MKADEIIRLFPDIYQRTFTRGSPLQALVQVMESLHRPPEEILARLEERFDAYRAPDHFVPYLAHWVDLDRFFSNAGGPEKSAATERLSGGVGRLRELIAAAVYLSQWRGTSRGLTRFLETATGVQGFELDEQVEGDDGLPRPYHVRVGVPGAAVPYIELIRRIVEQEKPAYVTHEFEIISNGHGDSHHPGE